MKEDISLHVEYDGIDDMAFGMASTLLGDMDAGRATILLREKFIDYRVHVYEPSAKTLKMQADFEGTWLHNIHCNVGLSCILPLATLILILRG